MRTTVEIKIDLVRVESFTFDNLEMAFAWIARAQDIYLNQFAVRGQDEKTAIHKKTGTRAGATTDVNGQ